MSGLLPILLTWLKVWDSYIFKYPVSILIPYYSALFVYVFSLNLPYVYTILLLPFEIQIEISVLG